MGYTVEAIVAEDGSIRVKDRVLRPGTHVTVLVEDEPSGSSPKAAGSDFARESGRPSDGTSSSRGRGNHHDVPSFTPEEAEAFLRGTIRGEPDLRGPILDEEEWGSLV